MHARTNHAASTFTHTPEGFLAGLLQGYRFQVCTTADTTAAALEVRRQVYVENVGYPVPVPDEYDHRSWLLVAEHLETGHVVGTTRITPRASGPLECEEYFELPPRLRSAKAFEITRFAILPPYRKGKTFLPVVSLGLFKLVHEILARAGAHYMVISARPERIWTYEWLRFQRTGLVASYTKLSSGEHELLWYDFRRRADVLCEHPFRDFFVSARYAEVVVPPPTVPSGLVPAFAQAPLSIAAGA